MSEHSPTAVVVIDDPDLVLGEAVAPPRRRSRGRQIAVTLGILLLLLAGTGGAAVYLVSETLGDNVARVPNVFAPLDAGARPVEGPAENFLVVGTDTRSTEPTTGTDAAADAQPGSQRSDVIMIVQLAADKKSAAVVSLPRDSWVDIPGRGMNKINAAYAFGGASLLVKTVEQLTGVRIDHFAVVDFAGFQAMVDAVGGIDVMVAEATSDRGVTFQKGMNHLDGADALVYVRQRHGLPNGDLDRAHREQNALRALLAECVSSGTLSNAVDLYRLIDATSRSVSVDETLSNGGLRELVVSSTGLQPSKVNFLSAPVVSLGHEGAQAVDYIDRNRSGELWDSLRDGTLGAYSASHPSETLSNQPA